MNETKNFWVVNRTEFEDRFLAILEKY